jgi:arylsulfatase A-like enzyme
MDKDLYESHRKARSSQPNVVFIMGDDVGWADVPWNNRELRLEFYILIVQPICNLANLSK